MTVACKAISPDANTTPGEFLPEHVPLSLEEVPNWDDFSVCIANSLAECDAELTETMRLVSSSGDDSFPVTIPIPVPVQQTEVPSPPPSTGTSLTPLPAAEPASVAASEPEDPALRTESEPTPTATQPVAPPLPALPPAPVEDLEPPPTPNSLAQAQSAPSEARPSDIVTRTPKSELAFELRLRPVGEPSPPEDGPEDGPVDHPKQLNIKEKTSDGAAQGDPRQQHESKLIKERPGASGRNYNPNPISSELHFVQEFTVADRRASQAPATTRSASTTFTYSLDDTAPPAAHPASVSNLRLQVEGPQGRPIDVRLQERDGRLHLAVHTQDTAYNEALRGRVGELLHDLEHRGFRSEDVAQPVKESANSEMSGNSEDSEQRQQRHHQQQQERQKPGVAWQGLFASTMAGVESTTGKE